MKRERGNCLAHPSWDEKLRSSVIYFVIRKINIAPNLPHLVKPEGFVTQRCQRTNRFKTVQLMTSSPGMDFLNEPFSNYYRQLWDNFIITIGLCLIPSLMLSPEVRDPLWLNNLLFVSRTLNVFNWRHSLVKWLLWCERERSFPKICWQHGFNEFIRMLVINLGALCSSHGESDLFIIFVT